MKAWLLTVSGLLSFGLALAIQEYSINFGYLVGVTLLAIHLLVIMLWFTRKDSNE
jgi:hypothetical protein